jgi:alpha-galactosidase
MTLVFQPTNRPFDIQADRTEETTGGLILHGAQANVHLPIPPQSYYRHGWQSWSLTTWQAANFQLPTLKPAILHPLQTDPQYALYPTPNGSWLGAVELEKEKVLLLGSLGLEAHVALHGQQSQGDAARLHGWYEVGAGDWFVGYGEESAVFARYAELLGKRLGTAPGKPTPRVWCSWYSLYGAIHEGLLDRVFAGLDGLPFDVLQIDDGWEVKVGDWEANEKFPSGMQALAANIRASGRTAGLWLAPLLVVPSSNLFHQHRDWLLRDANGKLVSAGHLWGEALYTLDTTHPKALAWLAALMKKVRAWGFDYLKLDFLYAGALPGKRHVDMPREAAYRQGLQAMREAMGADAYFLACGAPILPSLGLCDALRIGPDVAGEWESHRDAVLLYNPTTPGTRNAIRTTINRLWLKPLVATDPDVAYFCSLYNSLTAEQKRLLQALALICDFKATSDLPQWLNADEREALRAFLDASPNVEQTGRYTFRLDEREVDFNATVLLPNSPRGLDLLSSAMLGWAANQGWALKVFDQQGKKALQKKLRNLI